MTKEEAFHSWISQFGWMAYDENSVPDDSKLPYITYEVQTGNIDVPVYLFVTLWDRSTSWENITRKGIEISKALSYGGVTIQYDDGILFLCQGTPFTQRVANDEVGIRRLQLILNAEYISAY